MPGTMPPREPTDTHPRVKEPTQTNPLPIHDRNLLSAYAPPDVTEETLERIWQRVRREIQTPDAPSARPVRNLLPVPVRVGLAAAIVLVLALVTANSLAAQALPGSPLYLIKQGSENLRWVFALTTANRAQLALELADARSEEAARLVAQGGPPAVVAETLTQEWSLLAFAASFAPGAAQERVQRSAEMIARWNDSYRLPAQQAIPTWRTDTPPPTPTLPAAIPLTVPLTTPVTTQEPSAAPTELRATPTTGITAPTSIASVTAAPAPRATFTRAASPLPISTRTPLPQPTPSSVIQTLAPIQPTVTSSIVSPPTLAPPPTPPAPTVPLPTAKLPTVPPPPTLPLPPTSVPPTLPPPPTVPIPTLPPATVPPPPTVPLPTVLPPTLPVPTLPRPPTLPAGITR